MGESMRRSDKEIRDRSEIDRIIGSEQVCRIGLVDDGGAYIVPMSFAYDVGAGALFFHSAREGRKIRCIERSGRASFEIDRMLDIGALRPEEACTWTMSYESIMGNGRISLVDDPERKRHALGMIMAKYSGRTGWAFPEVMVARTAIIRLDIEEIRGKRSPAPVRDNE